MSELSNIGNNVLDNLSIRKRQEAENKSNDPQELGQNAFLELMIAQLNNQDPLSPQENGEFISQLAQFSSVEGIDNLNQSFDSFAGNFMSNQALQASSLVGRQVTIPADTTQLRPGGVISGVADLPASTGDLSIGIYNSAGALVQQVPVGPQRAGDINFRWDGRAFELNGEPVSWAGQAEEPLPPGDYQFIAQATVGGVTEQLDMALSANVNSVTFGANQELLLNLAGHGQVRLDDVKQFN